VAKIERVSRSAREADFHTVHERLVRILGKISGELQLLHVADPIGDPETYAFYYY
jgi:hypothetical protein